MNGVRCQTFSLEGLLKFRKESKNLYRPPLSGPLNVGKNLEETEQSAEILNFI